MSHENSPEVFAMRIISENHCKHHARQCVRGKYHRRKASTLTMTMTVATAVIMIIIVITMITIISISEIVTFACLGEEP